MAFFITFVISNGYDLLTFLIPSNIFGSSEGISGSIAIFTTGVVLCLTVLNNSVSASYGDTIVADFIIEVSIPSINTQFPAYAFLIGIRYLASCIHKFFILSITISS